MRMYDCICMCMCVYIHVCGPSACRKCVHISDCFIFWAAIEVIYSVYICMCMCTYTCVRVRSSLKGSMHTLSECLCMNVSMYPCKCVRVCLVAAREDL